MRETTQNQLEKMINEKVKNIFSHKTQSKQEITTKSVQDYYYRVFDKSEKTVKSYDFVTFHELFPKIDDSFYMTILHTFIGNRK